MKSDQHLEVFQSIHGADGKSWNCFDKGSGFPLVFLHNGGGTLWNWVYQLEYFSNNYRVIALDLPGFGKTYRPTEALTLDLYVKFLAEALEVLNIDRCVLIGNCIGSSIALEYAISSPKRVESLVLFNVCGGSPMLSPWLRFWVDWNPGSRFMKAFHRCMIDLGSHPWLSKFCANIIYGNDKSEPHEMMRKGIKQNGLHQPIKPALYELVRGLQTFSVFSKSREKPEPFPSVMLSWGSQNKVLDSRWADMIARWLLPEKWYLVMDAGHICMYEKPAEVNMALEEFIARLKLPH